MEQKGKIALAFVGGCSVVYAVAVLGFVATSPDIRLRCLLVDSRTASDGLSGIKIQATPDIDSRGPTPQKGDLLLKIGSQKISSSLDFTRELKRLRNAPPLPGGQLHAGADPSELDAAYSLPPLVEIDNSGRFVKVEILRPGWEQPRPSWLKVQSLPLGEVLVTLIWFVLQLGIVGFGAFAYWTRPFDRPSRLFFLLCLVTLGAFIGGFHWWVIAASLWLAVPFIVCAAMVPAVMLHFFLEFPRPSRLMAQYPKSTIGALYALPVFTAVSQLILLAGAHWLSGSQEAAMRTGEVLDLLNLLRFAVYAYVVVSAAYFMAVLFRLRSSYRTARNPMERGQLKWLWRGGLCAGLFVGITLYLALFRRVDFALGAARLPMFFASLSFMFAYAVGIVRYRLLLVDQIISKGMLYYVVSSCLTIAFSIMVGLSVLLPQFLNISLSHQQALTVAAVLMVSVVILLWLRDLFQQSIDRQFFREKYQLDRALERMNRAVGNLVTPESLAEMMLGSCRDVLGVRRAAFYLRTTLDGPFQMIAASEMKDTPVQIGAEEELMNALADAGSLQRVTSGTRGEMTPTQRRLHELDADLVHALKIDRTIIALVLLGEKKGTAPFTAEDLTFLNALGQITNVALHSAKVDQDVSHLNEDLQLRVDTISQQKRQIAMLKADLSLLQDEEIPKPGLASAEEFQRGGITGNSPAIRKVLETVRKVAASDASVLVRGESGTGKELLARVLHDNSHRSSQPMIGVHCASLSPGLLESELFGHVKGAFTGAHKDKIGRFEAANGGTLFLDEIGDISLETQIKLLRVLQERCFEPVGSTKSVHVDVRLITATHQNLERLIEQGRFREDLYYRLNVISITLPPLRERKEDILELAFCFLSRTAARIGRRIEHIDDEVISLLEQHRWPGNIRELENVLERAVVLADGDTVTAEHLPSELLTPPARFPRQIVESKPIRSATMRMPAASSRSEKEFSVPKIDRKRTSERELLRQALEECQGNKAMAARLLGIPRSTFFSKLKKHALS